MPRLTPLIISCFLFTLCSIFGCVSAHMLKSTCGSLTAALVCGLMQGRNAF
jgi:hypothetical protein